MIVARVALAIMAEKAETSRSGPIAAPLEHRRHGIC